MDTVWTAEQMLTQVHVKGLGYAQAGVAPE
jgi:hypothetical protein